MLLNSGVELRVDRVGISQTDFTTTSIRSDLTSHQLIPTALTLKT